MEKLDISFHLSRFRIIKGLFVGGVCSQKAEKKPQIPFKYLLLKVCVVVFLWSLKTWKFSFQVRLDARKFLWRVTLQKISETGKGKEWEETIKGIVFENSQWWFLCIIVAREGEFRGLDSVMEMKQNCFLPESLQNRRFENYPVKQKKKRIIGVYSYCHHWALVEIFYFVL